MIIFFTGVDCSGKDSIRHALSDSYNQEPFISSRSPICNMVYDFIYKRETEKRICNNYKIIESFLKLGAYFVLVTVDPKVLVARAKARNEKHVTDLKTFKEHQKAFRIYFRFIKEIFSIYKHRFIEVSNSSTLEAVVKKIQKKLY
jgi:thymidylate kinase